MKTELKKVSKDIWVVVVDGNEVGMIQKINRNSTWNVQFGIGRDSRHVGNTYDKSVAILMATDGVVR